MDSSGRDRAFFASGEEAERYAAHRPQFHGVVIDQIAEVTGRRDFARALDVGCGTGQSTVAVSEIVALAIGLDVSPAMIEQARRATGGEYVLGAAEALPFLSGRFDLITAGLAFHWFDRRAFLAEARRVLASDGWLVPYNNGFLGDMVENPDFAAWWQTYLERFPAPPRAGEPLTATDADESGFALVREETYRNVVTMTAEECADYLCTQTNIAAQLVASQQDVGAVAMSLREELEPLFDGEPRTLRFGGRNVYLRRRP